MALELMPLDVKATPAQVEAPNLDDLIVQVEKAVKDSIEFPVQEETFSAAKKLRADANKGKKKLQRVRIDTAKQLLGNWNAIAEKIQYAEKLEDELGETLGDQIHEYERQQKEKRAAIINKEIAKIAEEYKISPERIEFDDHWTNKSYQWPKIQQDIRQQAEMAVAQDERLAAQASELRLYAKTLDLEPDGYIGMLYAAAPLKQVKASMVTAVKARELEIQSRREQQEREAKEQAERIARAKQVGDKLIDEDSGEVVDQQIKTPTSNYRFSMYGLTEDQERYLEKFFNSKHIKFDVKEF